MKPSGRIARRYARALFSVGRERGDVRGVFTELATLTDEIVGSDDLRRVLFAPIHPRSERKGVFAQLGERLGLSAELRAFAALLVDENRTALLPAIREALEVLVDRLEGRLVAEITSARPLEPDEVARLTDAVSRRVGAQVTVTLQVDEGVLGGVVARVGDLLLDGTVRTQLAFLAGSLQRGSS